MEIDSKFKSIDYSQSLVDYTEERLSKVDKFELKPETAHVTFSARRHEKWVEICIQHSNQTLRASAKSDDYYDSVDKALHKLKQQLFKRKSKVQHHKRFSQSKEGRIMQLNAELETNYQQSYRRAG